VVLVRWTRKSEERSQDAEVNTRMEAVDGMKRTTMRVMTSARIMTKMRIIRLPNTRSTMKTKATMMKVRTTMKTRIIGNLIPGMKMRKTGIMDAVMKEAEDTKKVFVPATARVRETVQAAIAKARAGDIAKVKSGDIVKVRAGDIAAREGKAPVTGLAVTVAAAVRALAAAARLREDILLQEEILRAVHPRIAGIHLAFHLRVRVVHLAVHPRAGGIHRAGAPTVDNNAIQVASSPAGLDAPAMEDALREAIVLIADPH